MAGYYNLRYVDCTISSIQTKKGLLLVCIITSLEKYYDHIGTLLFISNMLDNCCLLLIYGETLGCHSQANQRTSLSASYGVGLQSNLIAHQRPPYLLELAECLCFGAKLAMNVCYHKKKKTHHNSNQNDTVQFMTHGKFGHLR